MKKNKWIFIPVGVIGALLLVTIISIGIMIGTGRSISTGRCLVAANDSYMIIMGNSPIVMSNQTNNEKMFENLSTGDKILLIHDGIQESYPGGTGAYVCVKIGDGTISDISKQVIDDLTEMGWIR